MGDLTGGRGLGTQQSRAYWTSDVTRHGRLPDCVGPRASRSIRRRQAGWVLADRSVRVVGLARTAVSNGGLRGVDLLAAVGELVAAEVSHAVGECAGGE